MLDPRRANTFYTTLQAAGMPDVPCPLFGMPRPETVTVGSYAELTIDGTKLRLVHCFSNTFGPLNGPGKSLADAIGLYALHFARTVHY